MSFHFTIVRKQTHFFHSVQIALGVALVAGVNVFADVDVPLAMVLPCY